MKRIVLAGLCLSLGGCAYNIKLVDPVDVAAIKPVVGARLALHAETAYSGWSAANYSPDVVAAFRNSGVFAEVIESPEVARSGYSILMRTDSNGPQKKFPSGPGGAALTFALLPVIPWRFESQFVDHVTVFYDGRQVAAYKLPYSIDLLVSLNPLYYLLGQPAKFGSAEEQGSAATRKHLASRHAGWVLNRMQHDGLLSGEAK